MKATFVERAQAAVSKTRNFRLNALAVALSQVGVREKGGNNRGEEVAAYLLEAGFKTPEPWCAAFVNWCAKMVELGMDYLSPLEMIPRQAYVPDYWRYFLAKGFIVPAAEVLPGDLFVLYYPDQGRYAHIGFVEEMLPGCKRFKTVEGNTNAAGSREGDGVYRKERPVTDNVKFIRWTRTVDRKP